MRAVEEHAAGQKGRKRAKSLVAVRDLVDTSDEAKFATALEAARHLGVLEEELKPLQARFHINVEQRSQRKDLNDLTKAAKAGDWSDYYFARQQAKERGIPEPRLEEFDAEFEEAERIVKGKKAALMAMSAGAQSGNPVKFEAAKATALEAGVDVADLEAAELSYTKARVRIKAAAVTADLQKAAESGSLAEFESVRELAVQTVSKDLLEHYQAVFDSKHIGRTGNDWRWARYALSLTLVAAAFIAIICRSARIQGPLADDRPSPMALSQTAHAEDDVSPDDSASQLPSRVSEVWSLARVLCIYTSSGFSIFQRADCSKG